MADNRNSDFIVNDEQIDRLERQKHAETAYLMRNDADMVLLEHDLK